MNTRWFSDMAQSWMSVNLGPGPGSGRSTTFSTAPEASIFATLTPMAGGFARPHVYSVPSRESRFACAEKPMGSSGPNENTPRVSSVVGSSSTGAPPSHSARKRPAWNIGAVFPGLVGNRPRLAKRSSACVHAPRTATPASMPARSCATYRSVRTIRTPAEAAPASPAESDRETRAVAVEPVRVPARADADATGSDAVEGAVEVRGDNALDGVGRERGDGAFAAGFEAAAPRPRADRLADIVGGRQGAGGRERDGDRVGARARPRRRRTRNARARGGVARGDARRGCGSPRGARESPMRRRDGERASSTSWTRRCGSENRTEAGRPARCEAGRPLGSGRRGRREGGSTTSAGASACAQSGRGDAYT